MYVDSKNVREVGPLRLLLRPKRTQFFFGLLGDHVLEGDFSDGIVFDFEKIQKIVYVSEYPN
jgi:hypothetical protein